MKSSNVNKQLTVYTNIHSLISFNEIHMHNRRSTASAIISRLAVITYQLLMTIILDYSTLTIRGPSTYTIIHRTHI